MTSSVKCLGSCLTHIWWWLPGLAPQPPHPLGPCPCARWKTQAATTWMGRTSFMSRWECKNYMETPRNPSEKRDSFGSSWLILPISGIWMRRLHSLRSQKVILLRIRPIMVSPMMASLALLELYKGINARDAEELLQRKTPNPLILKGER